MRCSFLNRILTTHNNTHPCIYAFNPKPQLLRAVHGVFGNERRKTKGSAEVKWSEDARESAASSNQIFNLHFHDDVLTEMPFKLPNSAWVIDSFSSTWNAMENVLSLDAWLWLALTNSRLSCLFFAAPSHCYANCIVFWFLVNLRHQPKWVLKIVCPEKMLDRA